MQKIRDNAVWVVGIAVVSLGALIFVDWGMSADNGLRHKNIVASVGNEDIPYEEFESALREQEKSMNESGQEIAPEQRAMMRRQVLEQIVQTRLFDRLVKTYALQGTAEQVLNHLRRNPPPGAERAPLFMGPDSQFSQAEYERWLANPKTFEDRYMQALESQISQLAIPQQVLGQLLAAALPSTSLEADFNTRLERTRGFGLVVVASADSFEVAAPSEDMIAKEFQAQKDSFWIGKVSAMVPAAIIGRQPTHTDSLRAKEDADSLVSRIAQGESFEELAKGYSEDPGSAKNGGSLGGAQSLSRYVPQFSAAAKLLTKGQVSAPVLSPFGYHIIKCLDRVAGPMDSATKTSDTLFDLQHILIKVAVSPETQDDLRGRLDSLRAKIKAGTDFATAAKAVGATLDSVSVLKGELGRSTTDPVPGASGWAFSGADREDVSEILENSRSYIVLGKPRITKPGRYLDLARASIATQLKRRQAAQKAAAFLKESRSKIQGCDTSSACIQALGKLIPTVFTERPATTWVPGLGYAPKGLLAAWSKAAAAPKTWVDGSDENGAFLFRLDSVRTPTDADFAAGAKEARRSPDMVARTAIGDLLGAMRIEARIESNLDQFTRD
ncbi:MAG TPA: peptidylprolyl isomerase [Fibrobacteria bacterium]|nr:peptidylprolyl isomerase [Fibrobacteria bacterium]